MISRSEGLKLAAGFLLKESTDWPHSEVRIIEEESFIDGDLLVVPYDSTAYLDGGDKMARLGGNLPLAVSLNDGKCYFLSFDDVVTYMRNGLI